MWATITGFASAIFQWYCGFCVLQKHRCTHSCTL
jgi:hypothetical protein